MRSACAHGAQAVRNDKGRAALHDRDHGLVDAPFRFHIDAGGGVIEDQNRWVEQDRPGDGQALSLPSRQRRAALADPGVIALRKAHDLVMELGNLGCPDHVLKGRIDRPIGDVVTDGGTEEVDILLHNPDIAP